MNHLTSLPRNAHIVVNTVLELKIENHRAVSNRSFLHWMDTMVLFGHWKRNASLMISQGFKFDAVIEELILNLQDPVEFGKICSTYTYLNQNECILFASTMPGKEITGMFIKKIKGCKNWDQLYTVMNRDGLFVKNLEIMVKKMMRQQWNLQDIMNLK